MPYTSKDLIYPDSLECYATQAVTYIADTYNTLGGCSHTCREAGYSVFAAQGTDCACLDILPSYDEKVDAAQCNQSCPGFASETCGGQAGYFTVGTVPGTLVTPSRAPSLSASTTGTSTTNIVSSLTASVSSSYTSPATAAVSPSNTSSNATVTSALPSGSSGSAFPAAESSAAGTPKFRKGATVVASNFFGVAVLAAVI